jgi:hypothetical protein
MEERAEYVAVKTVCRSDIIDLEQIPNVGPSISANLRLIGISSPEDLLGKDPYTMYDDLCDTTCSAKITGSLERQL